MRTIRSWGAIGATTVLLTAACTSGGSSSKGSSDPVRPGASSGAVTADRGAGFVDEAWFTGRQNQYLRYAT